MPSWLQVPKCERATVKAQRSAAQNGQDSSLTKTIAGSLAGMTAPHGMGQRHLLSRIGYGTRGCSAGQGQPGCAPTGSAAGAPVCQRTRWPGQVRGSGWDTTWTLALTAEAASRTMPPAVTTRMPPHMIC